jgi:hypothetical protein
MASGKPRQRTKRSRCVCCTPLNQDMQAIAAGQVQFGPSMGNYTDPVGLQNLVANAGLAGLCDIFGP